ncbi:Gp49 family protein [Oceanicella sp. SM1341]|uniref:Gp49 family protein n=1 Tax=Oceanicella sp. SM1341 TaxID=1548889 RepID=UPI001E3DB4E1|nr:Gp49 family protein [Oceanicella sp. SM1341]
MSSSFTTRQNRDGTFSTYEMIHRGTHATQQDAAKHAMRLAGEDRKPAGPVAGTIAPTQKENPVNKDERAIAAEIQAKGLTGKSIAPDMIDAEIAGEDYHVFPGSCLTVCCLTLQNGFTVTGESACASPENFNEGIGRKIARGNARDKIWPLLGFRLRDQLAA